MRLEMPHARIGMAGITGYVGWGGYAGTIRQHASDGHYECTVHGGINTALDMASVADGATAVGRQTDPALRHASPALTYVG